MSIGVSKPALVLRFWLLPLTGKHGKRRKTSELPILSSWADRWREREITGFLIVWPILLDGKKVRIISSIIRSSEVCFWRRSRRHRRSSQAFWLNVCRIRVAEPLSGREGKVNKNNNKTDERESCGRKCLGHEEGSGNRQEDTRRGEKRGVPPPLQRSTRRNSPANLGINVSQEDEEIVASVPVELELSSDDSGDSASAGAPPQKKYKMDRETRQFIVDQMNDLKKLLPSKSHIDQLYDNMNKNIEKNAEQIEVMGRKMDILENEQQKTRGSLIRLEHESTHNLRGLDNRIRRIVRETGGAGGGARGVSGASLMAKDEEFLIARKSQRCWPIRGKNDEEIGAELDLFFHNALQLTKEQIGKVSFKRVQSSGRVYDEVKVEFEDSETRDLVASRGPKMKSFIDDKGAPTAGMRMHIPNHLLPTFKLLNNYGYEMRKKFGPELRRYVKFDDINRSMLLQLKMPDADQWFEVLPEKAKEQMAKLRDKRMEEANIDITDGRSRSESDTVSRKRPAPFESPMNTPTEWAPGPRSAK